VNCLLSVIIAAIRTWCGISWHLRWTVEIAEQARNDEIRRVLA